MNHIKLFESFRDDYYKVKNDSDTRIREIEKETESKLSDIVTQYRNKYEDYLLYIIEKYNPKFDFSTSTGECWCYYSFDVNDVSELEDVKRELLSFDEKMKSTNFDVLLSYTYYCIMPYSIHKNPMGFSPPKSRNINETLEDLDGTIEKYGDGEFRSVKYSLRILLD